MITQCNCVIVVTMTTNHNINHLIITITISQNLIGAFTALFCTNYCVGLKLDSQTVGYDQIPKIGQLHQPIILSAVSLIHQSHNNIFITITIATTIGSLLKSGMGKGRKQSLRKRLSLSKLMQFEHKHPLSTSPPRGSLLNSHIVCV